ncbi:MAG: hypothetical protein V1724_00640 [Chloroflexota bacterium]
MEFQFERGTPLRPRGHALVYFQDVASDRLLAIYVVVLPVPMDIAKYLPPFLASHMGQAAPQELAAFALPPVPEEVSSHQELERLAELREDDLIYDGGLRTDDVADQMQRVNALVQRYAQLWQEAVKSLPRAVEQAQQEKGVVGVNEVLYSLMSEHDKLAEMSKLIARLRFAVEGRDTSGIKDAIEEIGILARRLPASYDVQELVRSASEPSRKGAELAKLYLERCYRLCSGDSHAAQELEERIRALQGP